jgi:hypothetical protein
LLAEERKRKREELLSATEKRLEKIRAATQRKRRPLRGKREIGQAVGTWRCTAGDYRMRRPDARSNASTAGSWTSPYNWTASPQPKNEERMASPSAQFSAVDRQTIVTSPK